MTATTEIQARLLFFFAVLLLVATWEWLAPRRRLTVPKSGRWFNNLGIIFLDSLLVKILFPVAAMGIAAAAHGKGWGLFNSFQLPAWLALCLSILILDLIIYLQHLMFHAVPALWRLHMVHHADLDFDVSTGLRFHPIEIILSMLIKMAAVAALGPPALAVLIFEISLNATAMFNHGNIRLPKIVDKYLRLLVVTPDMHRVHHSVIIRETNSNFGFNFPWWDRIFGTYRPQPVAGHTKMTIGITPFRKVYEVTLIRLLLLPFLGQEGQYSLKYTGSEPSIINRKRIDRACPK
jgi:sterol desaturase/sphingolipid hydroxylase (fatty acid hydroxylase superfamily)